MKKLCRKGTIHPSPPSISDQLSLLPATILTLAAGLTPQDREVLAYLLSCSNCTISNNINFSRKAATSHKTGDHPPVASCTCFRCYMSFWVRWDSSPNRQLIHEIIDAFEEGLAQSKKTQSLKGNKKDRKKRGSSNSCTKNSNGLNDLSSNELTFSKEEELVDDGSGEEVMYEEEEEEEDDDDDEEELEKGSIRKLVNFVGERIWNVWT